MDDEAADDGEEKEVETSPGRGGQPRLGSFVTIAVAILMLFGAASQVGKTPETLALFGIDQQAENRIRQEEERLRAAITLGAVPARPEELRPQAGSLPVREDALPPSRGEFDIDAYRRDGYAPVSMVGRNHDDEDADDPVAAFPGSIESLRERDDGYEDDPRTAPPQEQPEQPEYCIVANGDTWVKISRRTLGDANRWQEIMRANPASKNGLTVGMRLVIPRNR